ncbi:alpha/beta hydrolase [Rhodococcus sp. NPDC127530]|uniref:alpha/beta hydrolase n=1 Tax=unclassified Rhodococcus (in: high G+C Gram-positive bacteria) TaxID=192944 RepID=UPI00362F4115
MQQITVRSNVSAALGTDEKLETVATVCLPEDSSAVNTVCFAWPGGGYGRRYYTFDMPDDVGGHGQAGWHVRRGWVFVAVDHLAAGESSQPQSPEKLTYEVLVAANQATVENISELLSSGTLTAGFGPVSDPCTIGVGQSLGGAVLVLHQGQRKAFDGVGVLGWSGKHSSVWMPPGSPHVPRPYIPRGTNVGELSHEVHTSAMPEMALCADGFPLCTPGFHYDDEPADIVAVDMIDFPARRGELPEWASATIPPCSMTMMSPGAVAPEAASIDVPVFLGLGERDACADPFGEPKSYPASADVSVAVIPRMSHMHNFAHTRERLWTRLHSWAEGVAEARRLNAH